MLAYVIKTLIMLFLASILMINAKPQENSNHFFDKENSNAMREFWCIIVVLVYIPSMFQNKIQDILRSFAYIGVMFFIMTSSYGLKFSIKKIQTA